MNSDDEISNLVVQKVLELVRQNKVFDVHGRQIFERDFGKTLNKTQVYAYIR